MFHSISKPLGYVIICRHYLHVKIQSPVGVNVMAMSYAWTEREGGGGKGSCGICNFLAQIPDPREWKIVQI